MPCACELRGHCAFASKHGLSARFSAEDPDLLVKAAVLQIGRGSKTIEQSRKESAERQTRSRANKKARAVTVTALASAHAANETDAGPTAKPKPAPSNSARPPALFTCGPAETLGADIYFGDAAHIRSVASAAADAKRTSLRSNMVHPSGKTPVRTRNITYKFRTFSRERAPPGSRDFYSDALEPFL
jgi:hypothetical protein